VTPASATAFYARTTYRDAFGDPYEAPTGPLLGLEVTTDALGNSRATRPPPPRRRPVAKPIERVDPATIKRSMNYSRTTYSDAFGVPFPVPPAESSENWEVPAARGTRAVTAGDTRDPRWARVANF
jgi:hypothetical protein